MKTVNNTSIYQLKENIQDCAKEIASWGGGGAGILVAIMGPTEIK